MIERQWREVKRQQQQQQPERQIKQISRLKRKTCETFKRLAGIIWLGDIFFHLLSTSIYFFSQFLCVCVFFSFSTFRSFVPSYAFRFNYAISLLLWNNAIFLGFHLEIETFTRIELVPLLLSNNKSFQTLRTFSNSQNSYFRAHSFSPCLFLSQCASKQHIVQKTFFYRCCFFHLNLDFILSVFHLLFWFIVIVHVHWNKWKRWNWLLFPAFHNAAHVEATTAHNKQIVLFIYLCVGVLGTVEPEHQTHQIPSEFWLQSKTNWCRPKTNYDEQKISL